jgi:hypothetical protein
MKHRLQTLPPPARQGRVHRFDRSCPMPPRAAVPPAPGRARPRSRPAPDDALLREAEAQRALAELFPHLQPDAMRAIQALFPLARPAAPAAQEAGAR